MHLFVCIPCLNERDYLPHTIACLEKQTWTDYTVVFCVNQPENWWQIPEKKEICQSNKDTLHLLDKQFTFRKIIIDRSSPGLGWTHREGGVGWARKTAMDLANEKASGCDLILSLDADTTFNPEYFESVVRNFKNNHGVAALSVPYYHRLTGDAAADRAILRYEIYMRNYFLNLYRIRNPYCFTALGSAMVVPVKAYRAIGGMTPKGSGEDFYFLQKLRKFGTILNHNTEKVYPAARFSDRVVFGTGPAMIKGNAGDWESYPVYHHRLFDDVENTFLSFAPLFDGYQKNPMSEFLNEIFGSEDWWQLLRGNFKTREGFVRACEGKVDALRILQYLNTAQKKIQGTDEEHMISFLMKFFPAQSENLALANLSFSHSTIERLNNIRDFMAAEEEKARASLDQQLN